MRRNPSSFAAGAVALTLVLATSPAPTTAQTTPTTTGTQPAPQATPAPVLTPLPASSPIQSTGRAAGSSTVGATPAPFGVPTPFVAPAGGTALVSAPPTLPPASASRLLPYPAYGTPAPGVSTTRDLPGIPQRVTLQQAIAIAYAKSPLLAAARATVNVQRANTDLARTGYAPNVSAGAGVTESRTQAGGSAVSSSATTGSTSSGAGGSGSGGTTSGGTTTTTQSFASSTSPNRLSNSLSLSIRQLIYDGGRVAEQIRSAKATTDGSVATYQRQLQTVAFNVATAYYNQLAASRTTSVSLASVNLDLVQEQLVTAQIRAGVAAQADLATAQLQTAQARLAVVRSQATELTSEASIANAVGLDANITILPIDDAADPATVLQNSLPIAPYDTTLQRAIALRPDLASFQLAVLSARDTLKANRALRAPTLSGSGSASLASSDSSGGSFRNASSIGLSLSYPIFDQGNTNAEIALAQANLDLAQANLVNQQLAISLSVKQALVGLVSARAGVDQANAEYRTARVVLQSTQAQYRAGVTTLVQLLNSQVSFIQSLTDQVTSIYTLRQAEQTLLYATGENGFQPAQDPLAAPTSDTPGASPTKAAPASAALPGETPAPAPTPTATPKPRRFP
jgi:outer membrane protein TolC